MCACATVLNIIDCGFCFVNSNHTQASFSVNLIYSGKLCNTVLYDKTGIHLLYNSEFSNFISSHTVLLTFEYFIDSYGQEHHVYLSKYK